MIRTFHNHQLFHLPQNRGQEVLGYILRGLSDRFLSIGYCQGMNYVAGALMISQLDPTIQCLTEAEENSRCRM